MAFSLKAVLGLETTKFERGLASARKSLNGAVKGMMTSLGPLVGFVGFSAMANNALNLAREITNLSKIANTTGEDLQKLAFAAKTVGIEQEKLADIYEETGEKIGDFLQTGGGPLADFFENIAPKIGVTADMFRDLSGPDALQLYYNSVEKANLSQAEMTFYMKAIANDSTTLIPLLKDGGAGFKTLGEQAEAAGLILGDLERQKLEKINLKMDVWKKKATILGGELLTKLIPAFKILGDGLGFVADIFGASAAIIVQWGVSLGRVISAVVKPSISQIEALGMALKAAGQAATGDFDAAKASIEGAKQAVKNTVAAVKAIPGEMKAAASDLANTVEAAWDTLGDMVDKRSKQISDNIADITGDAKEAEDAITNMLTAGTGKQTAGGGTGDGDADGEGKGRMIELEQKLRKMKLAALKEEVRGNDEVAKAMQNRIKLAERILQIMRDTGATQREATIIANKQVREELAGSKSEPQTAPTDSKMRGKIRTGRIETGTIGGTGKFGSLKASMPTFDERMMEAGLFIRNDPYGGRGKPEDITEAASGGMAGNPFAEALQPAQKTLEDLYAETKRVGNELTRESPAT